MLLTFAFTENLTLSHGNHARRYIISGGEFHHERVVEFVYVSGPDGPKDYAAVVIQVLFDLLSHWFRSSEAKVPGCADGMYAHDRVVTSPD